VELCAAPGGPAEQTFRGADVLLVLVVVAAPDDDEVGQARADGRHLRVVQGEAVDRDLARLREAGSIVLAAVDSPAAPGLAVRIPEDEGLSCARDGDRRPRLEAGRVLIHLELGGR